MPKTAGATDGALTMRCSLFALCASIVCASIACAPANPTPDSAVDASSSDRIEDGSSPEDAQDGAQDVTPIDAAADAAVADAAIATDGACSPSDAGALQSNYYCDTASVHVLSMVGAPTRVMAFARLGTGGSTECGVVDSVEILRGSTVLQRVDAQQIFSVGATSSLVASATAEAMVEGTCTDRTGRLNAYGMIIRGRNARGPFEARCGTAESGGRWPPALHVACHRNLEQPPRAFPPAMFTVMSVGPGTATSAYASIPHEAGSPALTAIDGTIEVLSPQRSPLSPGAPLMGATTSGWMNLVSESSMSGTSWTQLTLNSFGTAPLPSELCPAPGMPGPGFVPPPYFLAKLTGRNARGAVSTEVLSSCSTLR